MRKNTNFKKITAVTALLLCSSAQAMRAMEDEAKPQIEKKFSLFGDNAEPEKKEETLDIDLGLSAESPDAELAENAISGEDDQIQDVQVIEPAAVADELAAAEGGDALAAEGSESINPDELGDGAEEAFAGRQGYFMPPAGSGPGPMPGPMGPRGASRGPPQGPGSGVGSFRGDPMGAAQNNLNQMTSGWREPAQQQGFQQPQQQF